MKNSKLLAKSITLGLILAMPYGVVSAEDITANGPWRVNLGQTLTGYENIKITGWSEISGKLGDHKGGQLGANVFETGNFRLNSGGEIYVDTLTTNLIGQDGYGNDIVNNISGKIYATNITFNNQNIWIQSGAEINATENFNVTIQQDTLSNGGIINVGGTFTLTGDKILNNTGAIKGNNISLGTGELRNNSEINITGSLGGGNITNNADGNMVIGSINSTGNVVNSGTIQGADGVENVSVIVTGNGELNNSGTININGELKTDSGRIYNSKGLTAGSITTKGQVRNDANGKISITDTINANYLYNSGSVVGKKLITPGGLTNGSFSAGTNPDAMLNFDDIDTRYIINTGKIEAQTIENDLNISNMGEMTVSETMTVDGVLKNDEKAVITAQNIIIKQDSAASGSDTTSFNKGSMTVKGSLDLQDGANFSFENGAGTSVNINNLQGDGNNNLNIAAGTTGIQIGTANLTNGNITINDLTKNQITIGTNNSTGLQVTGTSDATSQFNRNDLAGSLQDLADTVEIKNGEQLDSVLAQESGVIGETTALVDENGNVIANTVIEKGHIANEGITELANVAFMAWRAENDEMHQRMGELRSSNGEAGIWARMKRGESKYGDMDIKNQYSTYQLGYDEKVGDSNWYIGGAISRTEGKSSFATGSGENQSTGFTVYGTYVADDGQYVDLSAKYARLDNEFDVFGRSGIESTGDYRNNGYAFSAEYGKRIEAGNDFWIEPQVQLTYGHLSSANYTTSRDVRVTQDAMDSVVGRLGFAAGKDIGAGNVYVKASYLYDFDGDTNVKMTDGINSAVYDQDLGGGWFEVGIGTNINLSETSHLYFDVEKTYGGDIETPWQWNAGVRFDF